VAQSRWTVQTIPRPPGANRTSAASIPSSDVPDINPTACRRVQRSIRYEADESGSRVEKASRIPDIMSGVQPVPPAVIQYILGQSIDQEGYAGPEVAAEIPDKMDTRVQRLTELGAPPPVLIDGTEREL